MKIVHIRAVEYLDFLLYVIEDSIIIQCQTFEDILYVKKEMWYSILSQTESRESHAPEYLGA